MERHPERLSEGVQRKDGKVTPWNAGDAVGAVVDVCREMGIPVAPSIKARLGKGAKGLLECDFQPPIVIAAMVAAIRTGWFGSVETIAQEMAVATAGGRISRADYQAALTTTSSMIEKSESSVWQALRADMEAREQRRQSNEAR